MRVFVNWALNTKTLKAEKLLNKFRCFGVKNTKQKAIEAHLTLIYLDTI